MIRFRGFDAYLDFPQTRDIGLMSDATRKGPSRILIALSRFDELSIDDGVEYLRLRPIK